MSFWVLILWEYFYFGLCIFKSVILVLDFLLWKLIVCVRLKKRKKRSNTQIKNTRIYVIRQYSYINKWRQGESFTTKIGSYNSGTRSLSKNPNLKYTLTSLPSRITKTNQFSNILIACCGTYKWNTNPYI